MRCCGLARALVTIILGRCIRSHVEGTQTGNPFTLLFNQGEAWHDTAPTIASVFYIDLRQRGIGRRLRGMWQMFMTNNPLYLHPLGEELALGELVVV